MGFDLTVINNMLLVESNYLMKNKTLYYVGQDVTIRSIEETTEIVVMTMLGLGG